MNASEHEAKLLEILGELTETDIHDPELDLIEEGILDSLMFVELVVRLEEEFGVSPSIDDMDIENFASASRIVAYIHRKTSVDSGEDDTGEVGVNRTAASA
jgi:D-alanine--poly(phosphoribitol) ligase subunit 2